MSDHARWPQHDIHRYPKTICPYADSWQHLDIAESLGMPVGTLLQGESGLYCPACDYRPEQGDPAHRAGARA